jgi:hypothetical protein
VASEPPQAQAPQPERALSAGTALEWWVTTGGAGALSLSAGEVSSSITVTKVG